jgi:hypothetical protein
MFGLAQLSNGLLCLEDHALPKPGNPANAGKAQVAESSPFQQLA